MIGKNIQGYVKMGSLRNQWQKKTWERYHPHYGLFNIFLIEIMAIKPY